MMATALVQSTVFNAAVKEALLLWLIRCRAAQGSERKRLLMQVEAHAALADGAADQVWLGVLHDNIGTSTPVGAVAAEADRAIAALVAKP